MLLEQSVFPLSRGTFLFIWSMWNLFLSLSVVSESSYSQNNTAAAVSSVSHRDRGLHLLRFLFTHRSPDFNCLSSHFYLGKNPDGMRISTLFERAEKKDRWGQGTSWKKAWMRGWARKECEPSCAKYLTLSESFQRSGLSWGGRRL